MHAEDPSGGAADVEAEPGHVVRDGGGRRRVREGQHILRWVLRWILTEKTGEQMGVASISIYCHVYWRRRMRT